MITGDQVVRAIRLTELVGRYLSPPKVETLYRDFSAVVRRTWEFVGRALGESKDAAVKAFYEDPEAWVSTYDAWGKDYLNTIAENINIAMKTGKKRLESLIDKEANVGVKKQLNAALTEIASFKDINFAGLKRGREQKPVPSTDDLELDKLYKRLQGVSLEH